MSDDKSPAEKAGIATRSMDIAVALLILLIGAIVVFDSYRLGASWGDDGPQSGYFPFYIGLLLCLSSLGTLGEVALGEWRRRGEFRGAVAQRLSQFVSWEALRLVLSVLIPATVYVLAIQLIGIYVASAVYIALFMRWLGKYPWPKSIAVGAIVSAFVFALFEIWFKVPLYKGAWNPLDFLGY